MNRDFWTTGTKIAAGIGVVLLLGVMFYSWLVTGLVTCGGDGGSPYAAPASPRGKFCENGGTLLALFGPPFALVVGGAVADIRRSRTLLALAFAVAVAVAVAPILIGNALSKECAGRPSEDLYEESLEFERTHPGCTHY